MQLLVKRKSRLWNCWAEWPKRTYPAIFINGIRRFSLFSHVSVQGEPSGCSLDLVDIKTRVLIQYDLLMLKCNYCFDVNNTLGTTGLVTPYFISDPHPHITEPERQLADKLSALTSNATLSGRGHLGLLSHWSLTSPNSASGQGNVFTCGKAEQVYKSLFFCVFRKTFLTALNLSTTVAYFFMFYIGKRWLLLICQQSSGC